MNKFEKMHEIKELGNQILKLLLKESIKNGIGERHLIYKIQDLTNSEAPELVYEFGDVYVLVMDNNEVHVGGHGDYSVYEGQEFESIDSFLKAVVFGFIEYKKYEISNPKGPLMQRFWRWILKR